MSFGIHREDKWGWAGMPQAFFNRLDTTLQGQIIHALRGVTGKVNWEVEETGLDSLCGNLSLNHLPDDARIMRIYRVAEEVHRLLDYPRRGQAIVTVDLIKQAVSIVIDRYKYVFLEFIFKEYQA
jgi:hypothetical protein